MAAMAETWHRGQRPRPQEYPESLRQEDQGSRPTKPRSPTVSFLLDRADQPSTSRAPPLGSHPVTGPTSQPKQTTGEGVTVSPSDQCPGSKASAASTQRKEPTTSRAEEDHGLLKTPSRARVCVSESGDKLYSPATKTGAPRSFFRRPAAEYPSSRHSGDNKVLTQQPDFELGKNDSPPDRREDSRGRRSVEGERAQKQLADQTSPNSQGRTETKPHQARENVTGPTGEAANKAVSRQRNQGSGRKKRVPAVTMNIDVVGRMRPQSRGEGKAALLVEASGRVAAQAGGPYFGFQTLHATNTSTYDVFRLSVETLLDLFLAGYNTCLLVGGESGSGKSFTLAGESSTQAGLVQMILDHLFAKLSEERYHPQTRMTKQDPDITIQMVEIYNELIKDLLHSPVGGSTGLLDLTESAEKGVHVKKATTVPVPDASAAYSYFRQGWGRRTEATTDHGPARKNAAMIFHVDLAVRVGDNPQPYRSRFTVVELPGLEKLSTDPTEIQLREGPKLSQALVALNQVTTSLSSHPFPDRVIHYGDSKLTQLLQEELGGNFKTRALICLKPKTDSNISNAILKFCTNLSHIRNFPIVNDGLAQGLLTLKGAKILELKQQAGSGPVHMTSTAPVYSDSAEEVRRLQTENLVLKDQTERLQLRLDRLQNKFGDVANTRTDLSQQLLLSEEEKLKVSQSLVDLQIENNKIREEAEAAKFELTNKIILLENQVLELEAERDKHKKVTTYSKERLSETEKDRKDLADEYVVLKTNYLALTKEHEKELTRNEELAIELLNLVNNKAALMRQVTILSNANPNEVGDPNAEVDRVRAIVAKNSSGRVQHGDDADKILGTQQDREAVEQTLFASKKKHESEIERVKRELGDDNKRMESRMTGIMKELADTRNIARERQQKISELNAKLITIRGEKQACDTQLNRLQHKVKDLGEDFRARLVKYVEDIADYVDKGSQGHHSETRLREYCDSMLKDIRRSHKEREQQLSEAAQTFRTRLQKTVHNYEEVLVAYRNLRQTCEARGFEPTDLGPDETQLKLSDTDIQTSHLREMDKLKGELTSTRNELDMLKMRYGLFGEDKDTMGDISVPGKSEMWGAMRKQMREFTLNTQQQLEQERARLLSENNVLKEQLKESQQYIDSHLGRYKQEVVRLRRMLGMNDEGVVLTDRLRKVHLNKR